MSKALFKSTSLVSTMTFISRILGFLRDMIVAQIFGVNASVDAFNVAFKIPNFMRNLFAEGSFSQAFVPVLSEYRQTRSPEEVKQFINHVAGSLGSALLLITVFGLIAAPLIVKVFAPGLDPYRFLLSSEMLRITFPYLMLISLTAFSSAILNSYGSFGVPAFTPALLNICLISTAFGITHYFAVPIEAQAWGVLLGGFLQLFFQLPFLNRIGFLPIPQFNWRDAGVRRVLKLMIPSLFGASVGQISILINTVFASFLMIGSISWLYYSERLAYFPLGVFGVALMTVVLPHLSRSHADKNPEKFAHTLNWGLRCNLVIGIPAALTMLILSGPLVTSLFQYGKFSVYDVFMTQKSTIAYAIGLPSFMLVKVLSAAFYAKQDVRTPVKIAVAAVVLNIILNAVLIFPLAHAGLALASSLGSWFNTFLLFFTLKKRGIYQTQTGWGKFMLQLIIANLLVAGFLAWASNPLSEWLAWRWPARLGHITELGLGAITLYFASLFALGMRKRDWLAEKT